MRESIRSLVLACLRDLHAESDAPELANPTEETRLYGAKSPLDSLGLVILLAEVEQRLAEQLGLNLTLASEKALSEARSPFRRVNSLVDYIVAQVIDADAAPSVAETS